MKKQPSFTWEEMNEPHDVEQMVSFDVCKAELGQIGGEIAAAAEGSDAHEELVFRKDALQIKIDEFEFNVENGVLNIEDYVLNMKKVVGRQRRLAAYLHRQRKPDDAIRIMKRIKIMEAEIAGAAT